MMDAEKYRVYNKSRGTVLSADVSAVDTSSEPFRALIEDLAASAQTGLWLKPFRGIPEAHELPHFDLLYLDQYNQVIKGTGQFSAHEFAPFSARVASALALPPQTITSTATHAGDQLIIAPPDETENPRMFAQVSATTESSSAVEPDISEPAQEEQQPVSSPQRKLSLLERFEQWLYPDSDRRRSERRALTGLVAYFWTGGSPQSYELGNISLTGVYLLTTERWMFETIIHMTLQKTGTEQPNPDNSVPVLAKVVRWGADGVGLEFILSTDAAHHKGSTVLPAPATDMEALLHFLRALSQPNSDAR